MSTESTENPNTTNSIDIKQEFAEMPKAALQVITAPAAFFRAMPRSGGFLHPLAFMVAAGLAAGLIRTLLALFGFSGGALAAGLAAIVLTPILVAVFGFVGAAILFAIWKLLGSRQSFETAYRAMAYCSAITPVSALLEIVPYLGGIAGIAWMTVLLVTVSTEVHGIKAKTAWVTFSIIGALFAATSLSAEIAGRKLSRGAEKWQQQIRSDAAPMEEMTPEEAGKAVGAFLKSLEEEARK